jgi:hypothetical protein
LGLFGWGRRRAPARRGNPNYGTSHGRGNSNPTFEETEEQRDERLRETVGLTAAGFRVKSKDSDQMRRLIQPWQSRAFSYYDQLGEIWYASQFYARMLSLLRLYPAQLNDDGEWEETEDADAVDALARIRDPGGGDGEREGLLSSYGRLQFIAGEGYLLCSVDPDTELEQWEMLSTDELRVQDKTIVRYRAPTMAAQNLEEADDDEWEPLDEDTAVVYRLWKRHPRYSMLADSPMKGVLDLCEELLLLTRAVRARARSRLAGSGILFISEDFSHAPLEATGDEDIDVDPILADLRDAMVAPITNEGAASAVVPIVVRGPTAAIKDGVKHLQIIDPTQIYPETGLRYECIKRIALGLDLPPEVLLGMTDANHWTGWLVDDQTWKAHGQPLANQMVNDLTTSYFLPELRSKGKEDWATFSIQYDASAVVNHPDRGKDAKDVYDRRAIGKEALRDATGFDENDAPTEDELQEMIGVAVHDGSLAMFGEPSVKAGGVETTPDTLLTPGGEVTSGQQSAEVEKGTPDDGQQPQTNGNGTAAEVTPGSVVGSALEAARVAGAADLAVRRFREQAGNRLLSLAKRDSDLLAEIRESEVKTCDIAAFLGRDRVRQLGGVESELVPSAHQMLDDTFRAWNLSADVRTVLLEQVERHAIRTLYDAKPTPLPQRFQTYVAGVLSEA